MCIRISSAARWPLMPLIRECPSSKCKSCWAMRKIDTTMHYAMVNQNNVKASHRRYLE